jgi:hypothetical protein
MGEILKIVFAILLNCGELENGKFYFFVFAISSAKQKIGVHSPGGRKKLFYYNL